MPVTFACLLLRNFVVQLTDHAKDGVEHMPAPAREMVVPACSRTATGLHFTPEPAVAFHSLEERVQRPWADVIPVPPELAEHPLPDHGLFGGVVENVHFPEAKENFSRDQLLVGRLHAQQL